MNCDGKVGGTEAKGKEWGAREGYVWWHMGVDTEEQGGGFKGLCLPLAEAAA